MPNVDPHAEALLLRGVCGQHRQNHFQVKVRGCLDGSWNAGKPQGRLERGRLHTATTGFSGWYNRGARNWQQV